MHGRMGIIGEAASQPEHKAGLIITILSQFSKSLSVQLLLAMLAAPFSPGKILIHQVH